MDSAASGQEACDSVSAVARQHASTLLLPVPALLKSVLVLVISSSLSSHDAAGTAVVHEKKKQTCKINMKKKKCTIEVQHWSAAECVCQSFSAGISVSNFFTGSKPNACGRFLKEGFTCRKSIVST